MLWCVFCLWRVFVLVLVVLCVFVLVFLRVFVLVFLLVFLLVFVLVFVLVLVLVLLLLPVLVGPGVGCCPFFDCMNAVAPREIFRQLLAVVLCQRSKFICV